MFQKCQSLSLLFQTVSGILDTFFFLPNLPLEGFSETPIFKKKRIISLFYPRLRSWLPWSPICIFDIAGPLPRMISQYSRLLRSQSWTQDSPGSCTCPRGDDRRSSPCCDLLSLHLLSSWTGRWASGHPLSWSYALCYFYPEHPRDLKAVKLSSLFFISNWK